MIKKLCLIVLFMNTVCAATEESSMAAASHMRIFLEQKAQFIDAIAFIHAIISNQELAAKLVELAEYLPFATPEEYASLCTSMAELYEGIVSQLYQLFLQHDVEERVMHEAWRHYGFITLMNTVYSEQEEALTLA